MSARTSSALPFSSAWMKVGMLFRHGCRPVPKATEAGAVDQLAAGHFAGYRVDEHRSGILPTGLIGPAPVHDLAESDLQRPLDCRARAARVASMTNWVGESPLPRKRNPSCSTSMDCTMSPFGVISEVSQRDRWRATPTYPIHVRLHSYARRPRPNQARQPPTRIQSSPPRRLRRAKTGRRTPLPAVTVEVLSVDLDVAADLCDRERDPAEPGVSDEQIRPTPDHQKRKSGTLSAAATVGT